MKTYRIRNILKLAKEEAENFGSVDELDFIELALEDLAKIEKERTK